MKRAVDVYGFINAKLRAKIGKLRTDNLEEDLLKTGSLVEAIGILREHGYTEAAETYDKTGDLQMVELSLLRDEIKDFRSVGRFVQDTPSEMVSTLLSKIELENLKNALRLWYSSAVHRRPITYRTSYLIKEKIVNNINYIALVNAISYNNIIDAVSGTWYETILKQFTFEQIEREGLFFLESALDKFWYSLLYKASTNLKGDDKSVALRLFSMEVDLKNILMLIRYGWFHKMEGTKLKTLLYPYGQIYKSEKTNQYLNTNPKDRDVSILLNEKYPGLVKLVQTWSPSDSKSTMINHTRSVERFLLQEKKKIFTSVLGGKPFTIGIPLAYFYLREEHYYMICGILGGKYYGIDSEEIKGILS